MTDDKPGAARFSVQRKERLLEELRRNGSVLVTELAQLLEVSEMTVRRDINDLARQGRGLAEGGQATLEGEREIAGSAGDIDDGIARSQIGLAHGGAAPRLITPEAVKPIVQVIALGDGGEHALHAAALEFIHPIGKNKISLSAELPEDLRGLLTLLRGKNAFTEKR